MNKKFKYAIHKLHIYCNSGAATVNINKDNYNYYRVNPLQDFPVLKNSSVSINGSGDFGPAFNYSDLSTYLYTDYNRLLYTNDYSTQITTSYTNLSCNFIPGLPLELTFIYNSKSYTVKAYFFGYYFISIPDTSHSIILTVVNNTLKIKASTTLTLTCIKQYYNDKELYMLNNTITTISRLNITTNLFMSYYIQQHTCVEPLLPLPFNKPKLKSIIKLGSNYILHYGRSIYTSKDKVSWKPFYHQLSWQANYGNLGNVVSIHDLYYLNMDGNNGSYLYCSKDLQAWNTVRVKSGSNYFNYNNLFSAGRYLFGSEYILYGTKTALKMSGDMILSSTTVLKGANHIDDYSNNNGFRSTNYVSKIIYYKNEYYIFPYYKYIEESDVINTQLYVYYAYYKTKDFETYTQYKTFESIINKPTNQYSSSASPNWSSNYTVFDSDKLQVAEITFTNNKYYLNIRDLQTNTTIKNIEICNASSSYNNTQYLYKSKNYYYCTIYNNSRYETYKINPTNDTVYTFYTSTSRKIYRLSTDTSLDFISISFTDSDSIYFIKETETSLSSSPVYSNNITSIKTFGGLNKMIWFNYNNTLYTIMGTSSDEYLYVYKSTDYGNTWNYVTTINPYNHSEYGKIYPRMDTPYYINNIDSNKTITTPLRLYCNYQGDIHIDTSDMTTFTTGYHGKDNYDWTIDNIDGIAYGNNKYVAINCADNNTDYWLYKYSTNMSTWNKATYPTEDNTIAQPKDIIFFNNKFIAFPKYLRKYLAVSTDGITWTKQSADSLQGYYIGVWKVTNNLLVIQTDSSGSYYSTDGSTWTKFYDPSDNGHIMYINGKYWTYTSSKFCYATSLQNNSNSWTYINFTKKGEILNAIPIKNYILLQQSESNFPIRIDTSSDITQKQKFIISKEL